MPSLQQWLDERHTQFDAQRRYWLTREMLWSGLRLLTFFGIFFSLIAWHEQAAFCGTAIATCIIAFIASVRIHRRRRATRLQAERTCDIIDEARQRNGGQLVTIRSGDRPDITSEITDKLPAVLDSGSTWALTEQECDDLDLYAKPTGLFGLLNRCSSLIGEFRLNHILNNPCLSAESIRDRQAAVRWLVDNADARLAVMGGAAGLRKRDDQLHRLIGIIASAELLANPTKVKILRIWSAFTGVMSVVAFAAMWRSAPIFWMSVLAAIAVINFILLAIMRDFAHGIIVPWRYTSLAANGWTDASTQAAKYLPDDTLLATLKRKYTAVVDNNLLLRLCGKLGWVDAGGPVYGIARVIAFYDLHVADSLMKLVAPHQRELLESLSAVAELEAMTSLSCFATEQPVTTWPKLIDDRKFQIVTGHHPLIAPDIVVANDLSFDEQMRMWIITGSNMAGKSTYVRMVGINSLLSQIGGVALAEAMTFTPVRLISDLRARDDLAKEESYFLAEVRQLRRMLLADIDGAPILALVDELFRGTNSEEQAAACHGVVRHMWDAKFFVLFATHERTLTDLADNKVSRNFHFRESLDGEEMAFDYKLRPGAAQTRNALRVLQREGYPPLLLDRAHAWLAERGHDDYQAR